MTGPGSEDGIATGYGLDGPGSNPTGGRFFAPVQTGPGAHRAFCTMGTGSFPGVKSGRGVTLSPHPILVPWSRKSRAITLPPYGLYGLYRASVPVQGCILPLPFKNDWRRTSPPPIRLHGMGRESVTLQPCLIFKLYN
jgi:hypothetical protein